jgi:hypothetical protein
LHYEAKQKAIIAIIDILENGKEENRVKALSILSKNIDMSDIFNETLLSGLFRRHYKRFSILKRDNFSCVFCGASPRKDSTVTLHVDHIHPISKANLFPGIDINDPSNLQTLCESCNLGKGAQVL